ncbi:SsgA family sporulation/cell division regulator [Streptomyces sp. NBC_00391]|uniref:SsgA family sporulation/cell division regulator n=1 Tax=Streptomyces sp. NBC_00391 TaxID=2903647 RepID=UPI002E241FE1
MTAEVHKPVSAALAMNLHLPQPCPYLVITAFLHYAPESPYAVSVTFPVSRGNEPIVWYMSRDLIRDGLSRLTGEGDVQIGPDPNGSDDVAFRLQANGLSALLTAPRQPIKDFLQRTAEVVPYGRETAMPGYHSQLHATLARLLTGS